MTSRSSQVPGSKDFRAYLQKAADKALHDDPTLQGLHKLCRRPVLRNWKGIKPEEFLAEYLWCVGSIRKKFHNHQKYYPCQKELFRRCKPDQIVSDARSIRAEWKKCKRDLNSKMVEAVIMTATEIGKDWNAFKQKYLPRPVNPQSESPDDWWDSFAALDQLRLVGGANGWYLIRNLYGAPFFKPDVQINAIAKHFFRGNLQAMTSAVRKLWPQACVDKRFNPVHLGEVDFVLWWYRSQTGDPPNE
jgi:hypothetical protein